jgi:hypothetical protein
MTSWLAPSPKVLNTLRHHGGCSTLEGSCHPRRHHAMHGKGFAPLDKVGLASHIRNGNWVIVIFGELGNEADLSLKAFIICPGLAT